MQKIFRDISQCLNQRDDLFLEGGCWEEHNEVLEAVLKRVSDFGITFHRKKCICLERVNLSFTDISLQKKD